MSVSITEHHGYVSIPLMFLRDSREAAAERQGCFDVWEGVGSGRLEVRHHLKVLPQIKENPAYILNFWIQKIGLKWKFMDQKLIQMCKTQF